MQHECQYQMSLTERELHQLSWNHAKVRVFGGSETRLGR